MGFIQYIKDTRGELHHVAWPSRLQTIVYTILVIILSVFIALYLGLFDFVFTTGLSRALPYLSQRANPAPISTSTPEFDVTPVTTSSTTVPITPLQ